ncbi:Zinc finger, CCCH-type [Dillenia turbinata]|uniref:Zinc finger, CCCH-type n=1 Tax=Dillenia turbinata TaxID=194707 RepID=A0AAN8V2I4_9MAGN
MDVGRDANKRVFNRLGPGPSSFPSSSSDKHQKVCFHWRAGKCNRNPCPFLHRELPPPPLNGTSKRSYGGVSDDVPFPGPRHHTSFNSSSSWGQPHGSNKVVRKTEKVCHFWEQGNCKHGDTCRFLHSWSLGDSFQLLTQLEGHQEGVSGITLPSGSDKLYTGSKDNTLRAWDCQSGQCVGMMNLGDEVGCMISEGPWIFIGLPNLVKVLNLQTNVDQNLNGPVGQVYAMVVGNDLLFAGTQDGSVLAWKFNDATNCFEPATMLKLHDLAVVSLVVGANRLYSGSMDKSIRVWDLETLQCIQTLTDHTSVVMSILCWDKFLLSCSLDKSIKVWFTNEIGKLEVTYTHNEEHGLLTLCGMLDLEGKPVLLCSCNDNSVRVYDLPSFFERGKILAKQEVRSIQAGPGLFFTGDGTGQLKVWKWLPESKAAS